MPRVAPSQVLRFIASIPVIVLLTVHSPAAAQQKTAPPSPHSQAQLADRVKELETRLNAAEQKAASAAMEKDYITRVQKQYETYYEKAFNTQLTIVSIIALFITIVFGLAARFGFAIFDRSIQLKLSEASTQLRTEFTQMLGKETQALREANSSQLKALEDGLTKRITELEDGLAKRITQQEQDLKAKSNYQFQFAQGLGFFANDVWNGAITHFRRALTVYKQGKPGDIFEKRQGQRVTANIFLAIRASDKAKFEEAAKKELELEVYQGLQDELAFAATEVPELLPLLSKK